MSVFFLGVLAGWLAGIAFTVWVAHKGYLKGARPDPSYQGREDPE